jgi:hypothetical protein
MRLDQVIYGGPQVGALQPSKGKSRSLKISLQLLQQQSRIILGILTMRQIFVLYLPENSVDILEKRSLSVGIWILLEPSSNNFMQFLV